MYQLFSGASRSRWRIAAIGLLLFSQLAQAQPAPNAQPPAPEPPRDTLGRDTPRGTILGFMNAARRGNDEVAVLYLNTRLRDKAALERAHQLYVVLDSRLPARLNDLSDRPEGSRVNPLKPDQDVVGTIDTRNGPLELTVERVERGASGQIWLFSNGTLEAIPEVYDEVSRVSPDRYLPGFLAKPRIAGVRLFEWLAAVLLIPLVYGLLGLLSRGLRPLGAYWYRRRGIPIERMPKHLPGSFRLLLLAISIRWVLEILDLPLLERLLWAGISAFLVIVAVVWMLLQLNAYAERYLIRYLNAANLPASGSLLRLLRRVADVFVIAAGVLVSMRYFGFDATAALAGLGIGGIAVALAAQKTLENVIGGLSLIFDNAVRVGDFIKCDQTSGTVDYIGLRSTRIRTVERSMVTIPNGQFANQGIETLSARDKFWFHHFVCLQYDTTHVQMRAVIEGVRDLLAAHPSVDVESVRVQFFRLGPSSLDVELSAYFFARDWNVFMTTQQEVLLRVMEIIGQAGTAIAYPSQTLHIAEGRVPLPAVQALAPAGGRGLPPPRDGASS